MFLPILRPDCFEFFTREVRGTDGEKWVETWFLHMEKEKPNKTMKEKSWREWPLARAEGFGV